MADASVHIHSRVSGDDIGLPTSLEDFQKLTRRRRVCSPGACKRCRAREGEMAPGEDVKLHHTPPCQCREVYIDDD